jgi:hypothetical protein
MSFTIDFTKKLIPDGTTTSQSQANRVSETSNKNEPIRIELEKTVDPYEKPPQSETRSDQNEEAFMKDRELEGNSITPNDPDVLYEEDKVVENEAENRRLNQEANYKKEEEETLTKNTMTSNKSSIDFIKKQINDRYNEFKKLYDTIDISKIIIVENKDYVEETYKENNKNILTLLKTEYDKINRIPNIDFINDAEEIQKIANDATLVFDDYSKKVKINEFLINDRKIKNVNDMYGSLAYIKKEQVNLKLDPRFTKLFSNYGGDEVDDSYGTKTLSNLNDLYSVKEEPRYDEIIKYLTSLINSYTRQNTEDYTLYNAFIQFKNDFNDNDLKKITETYNDASVNAIINTSNQDFNNKIGIDCTNYKSKFAECSKYINNQADKDKINNYSADVTIKDKTAFNHYSTNLIAGLTSDYLINIKKLDNELEIIDKDIEEKEKKNNNIKTTEDEDKKLIKKVLTSCKIDNIDTDYIKKWDDLHTEFVDSLDPAKSDKIKNLNEATRTEQTKVYESLTNGAAKALYADIKTETDSINKVNIDPLNVFINDEILKITDNITHDDLDALVTELEAKIIHLSFTNEETKVKNSLAKCLDVNNLLLAASDLLIVKVAFEEDEDVARAALEQIRLSMKILDDLIDVLYKLNNKFLAYKTNIGFAVLLIKNYKLLQTRIDAELVNMKTMLKPIRDFKNSSAILLMNTLSIDLTAAPKNDYKKFIQALIQVAINDNGLKVLELINWLNESTDLSVGTIDAKFLAYLTTKGIKNKSTINKNKNKFNDVKKALNALNLDNSFNGLELANFIYLSIEKTLITCDELIAKIDELCKKTAAPDSLDILIKTDAPSYRTANAPNIDMHKLYTDIQAGQKEVKDFYDKISAAGFISHYGYNQPDLTGLDLLKSFNDLNAELSFQIAELIKNQTEKTAILNPLINTHFAELEQFVNAVNAVDNAFNAFDDTIVTEFTNKVDLVNVQDYNQKLQALSLYLEGIKAIVNVIIANPNAAITNAITANVDFLTKIITKIDLILAELKNITAHYTIISGILTSVETPVKRYNDFTTRITQIKGSIDLTKLDTSITELSKLDFDAKINDIDTLRMEYNNLLTSITSTIPSFEVLKKIYKQAEYYLVECKDKLTNYKQITENKLDDYKNIYKNLFDTNEYIDFLPVSKTNLSTAFTTLYASVAVNLKELEQGTVKDPINAAITAYDAAYVIKKELIDGVPDPLDITKFTTEPEYLTAWKLLVNAATTNANNNALTNFNLTTGPNVPFIKGGGRVLSNICIFTFNNTVMVLITIIILYILYHMLFIDRNNALYRLINYRKSRQKRLPNYACDMQINTRYNRELYTY